MTTTKQIAAERWENWCDTFTNGNLGRLVRIKLVSEELGDQTLAEGAPLMAIVFPPMQPGASLNLDAVKEQVDMATYFGGYRERERVPYGETIP